VVVVVVVDEDEGGGVSAVNVTWNSVVRQKTSCVQNDGDLRVSLARLIEATIWTSNVVSDRFVTTMCGVGTSETHTNGT